MQFKGRILVIGFGAVAQCTLPILFKHIEVPYGNVNIIDFEENKKALKPWLDLGVGFEKIMLTIDNYKDLLARYVGDGDMIIDLAWNIGTAEIIEWCQLHNVRYINTALEEWDPYTNAETKHPTKRTLYHRHMLLRERAKNWHKDGPTAIIEHGANPGLISHFAKQGLIDIARKSLEDKRFDEKQSSLIANALQNYQFNVLAKELGVKVIHVSERDTQITSKPKQVDEFVNTWSVEGFHEEGTTTAELGWGTHEKELPPRAFEFSEGPKNQICLAQMGMNTWVSTWVPFYDIQGMIIRHGEAFTLSDYLTIWDQNKAVYRPTVHYAYCPSDSAIASLNELRGNDYIMQSKQRILNNDIISGEDILGALIMGHPYQSWWTGSILSIDDSRKMVPNQNATTVQVAVAVVAGVNYMIKNPNKGLLTAELLPHDEILDFARPYLGTFISIPVNWHPLKNFKNYFQGYVHIDVDKEDVWQFKNFYIDYD